MFPFLKASALVQLALARVRSLVCCDWPKDSCETPLRAFVLASFVFLRSNEGKYEKIEGRDEQSTEINPLMLACVAEELDIVCPRCCNFIAIFKDKYNQRRKNFLAILSRLGEFLMSGY